MEHISAKLEMRFDIHVSYKDCTIKTKLIIDFWTRFGWQLRRLFNLEH